MKRGIRAAIGAALFGAGSPEARAQAPREEAEQEASRNKYEFRPSQDDPFVFLENMREQGDLAWENLTGPEYDAIEAAITQDPYKTAYLVLKDETIARNRIPQDSYRDRLLHRIGSYLAVHSETIVDTSHRRTNKELLFAQLIDDIWAATGDDALAIDVLRAYIASAPNAEEREKRNHWVRHMFSTEEHILNSL